MGVGAGTGGESSPPPARSAEHYAWQRDARSPRSSSSSTSTSSAARSTCCSRSSCAKRSTCCELALADVVLAYLDHLEQRGELDLETATEFIVLVAALLELKSRLLLGGEEEELLDIEPEEAAEELLARMLDASRYRAAAAPPARALAQRARRALPRGARCPPSLRRAIVARRPTARRSPRIARGGDRADADAAAGDQRAPHRRPPRQRRPSASRTCARLLRAGASASTRPSAAPIA